MDLQLKNIKVNLAFSEETIMFQADVFANGKKIAYAKNDGRGGCTFYYPYENQREALIEAEKYATTLPSIFFEMGGNTHELEMNLECWINLEIEDYINTKKN